MNWRLNDRNNESLDYTFKTIPRLKIIPKYVPLSIFFASDLRFSNRRISQLLFFDSFLEASRTIHHREVGVREECEA